jgi:hypothetical protein
VSAPCPGDRVELSETLLTRARRRAHLGGRSDVFGTTHSIPALRQFVQGLSLSHRTFLDLQTTQERNFDAGAGAPDLDLLSGDTWTVEPFSISHEGAASGRIESGIPAQKSLKHLALHSQVTLEPAMTLQFGIVIQQLDLNVTLQERNINLGNQTVVLSPPSRFKVGGFYPSSEYVASNTLHNCINTPASCASCSSPAPPRRPASPVGEAGHGGARYKSSRPAYVARVRFLDGIVPGRLSWRQDGLNVLFTPQVATRR